MSDIDLQLADTVTITAAADAEVTAVNPYSMVTALLQQDLTTYVTGLYPGLVVVREHFKAASLVDFTRYCIVISPAPRPWAEKRLGVGLIQYWLTVDVYLFVKNFHEEQSLFGVNPPGLFQFISDTKDRLRLTNLGGFIDKTYDEVAAPIEFEMIPGFDTGEHTFVHRARIAYQCRTQAFCHPRL